jgi:hypothetical protein
MAHRTRLAVILWSTGFLGFLVWAMPIGLLPQSANSHNWKPITNQTEFRQAMKELSNWGPPAFVPVLCRPLASQDRCQVSSEFRNTPISRGRMATVPVQECAVIKLTGLLVSFLGCSPFGN